jgi:hypothetical protein
LHGKYVEERQISAALRFATICFLLCGILSDYGNKPARRTASLLDLANSLRQKGSNVPPINTRPEFCRVVCSPISFVRQIDA